MYITFLRARSDGRCRRECVFGGWVASASSEKRSISRYTSCPPVAPLLLGLFRMYRLLDHIDEQRHDTCLSATLLDLLGVQCEMPNRYTLADTINAQNCASSNPRQSIPYPIPLVSTIIKLGVDNITTENFHHTLTMETNKRSDCTILLR